MNNNNYPTERGVRNPNAPIGTHTAQGITQPTGTTGGMTYGQSAASGPAPTTAGHHKHDVLNKLDPRIDSTHDRDPMAAHTGAGSGIPEGTYGPHSSRLANALDPRVDSDLDSTRAAGAGAVAGSGMGMGMGTGGGHAAAPAPAALGGYTGGASGFGASSGTGVPEGTYGPHSSRVANALDPRVDSDRDRHVGPGATHAPGAGAGGGMAGMTGGSSTTSAGMGAGVAGGHHHHTAGPHKSDLLNKLDPRVDSKTGAWKGHGHGHGHGQGGTGGQGPVV